MLVTLPADDVETVYSYWLDTSKKDPHFEALQTNPKFKK